MRRFRPTVTELRAPTFIHCQLPHPPRPLVLALLRYSRDHTRDLHACHVRRRARRAPRGARRTGGAARVALDSAGQRVARRGLRVKRDATRGNWLSTSRAVV